MADQVDLAGSCSVKNRDRSDKLKRRRVIGNVDEDKKEAERLENRAPESWTRHAANAIIGINVSP